METATIAVEIAPDPSRHALAQSAAPDGLHPQSDMPASGQGSAASTPLGDAPSASRRIMTARMARIATELLESGNGRGRVG